MILALLLLQASTPPGRVEALIAERGERPALEALLEDPPAWQATLDGIASGSPDWLRLGRRLRRHTDADASEWLDLALSEALAPAAAAVLEVADGTIWHVGDVCGTIGFAERGASDGASIARYVEAREAALRAVDRSDLLERRDECLELLLQRRASLLGGEREETPR